MMKHILIIIISCCFLFPSPAGAVFIDENNVNYIDSAEEDYRLFREEKKKLSLKRAFNRGLPARKKTPPAPDNLSSAGPVQTTKNVAPAGSSSPANARRFFIIIILALTIEIAYAVMSIRCWARKQEDLKKGRKAWREKLHREIEDQFRSYFPRGYEKSPDFQKEYLVYRWVGSPAVAVKPIKN